MSANPEGKRATRVFWRGWLLCAVAAVVALLIAISGWRVATHTERAFYRAVRSGDIARMSTLLADRPELADSTVDRPFHHVTGVRPLMVAAKLHRADMIELLLTAGADVTLRDNYGQNAIHYVIMQGCCSEVFHALWAAGARWSQSDLNHYLAMAAGPCDADVLAVLLAAGAKPVEFADFSLVASSVRTATTRATRLLVDAGADVNKAIGHSGETALMRAAHFGNVELVEFLLERGANPHARDRYGRTAIDYADRANDDRSQILVLLKEAMRDER